MKKNDDQSTSAAAGRPSSSCTKMKMEGPTTFDLHTSLYVPSPFFYYDQSNVALIVDSDPFCSRKVVNLFVGFVGDYFFSQNVSQIPEYPNSDSPWAEFVRAFADQPAAIHFVRGLSALFKDPLSPENGNTLASISIPDSQNTMFSKGDELSTSQQLTAVFGSRCLGEGGQSSFAERPRAGLPKETFLEALKLKKAFQEGPRAADQVSANAAAAAGWHASTADEGSVPPPPSVAVGGPGGSGGARGGGGGGGGGGAAARACEAPGCATEAGYNFRGRARRRFCRRHAAEGMVSVVKFRACEAEGCTKVPLWNHEGETTRRFCHLHKAAGMVNLKGRRCAHPAGCAAAASCNLSCLLRRVTKLAKSNLAPSKVGETIKLYCGLHKLPGMVVVGVPRCEAPGCATGATMNFAGERRGRFCARHKVKGMLHVQSRFCEDSGCTQRATYNIEGERKGLRCRRHRRKGMVNVYLRTCLSEGCLKVAYYNFEGEKKGQFCATHRMAGMVSVAPKPKPAECDWALPAAAAPPAAAAAAASGAAGSGVAPPPPHPAGGRCGAPATHRGRGDRRPRRCPAHATPGMLPRGRAFCRGGGAAGGGGGGSSGCAAAAALGFPGEPPRACAAHALPGMRPQLPSGDGGGGPRRPGRPRKDDPASGGGGGGPCAEEGCGARAAAPPGRAPRRCKAHARPGELPLPRERLCQSEDCIKKALYNTQQQMKPVFCKHHKEGNMVRTRQPSPRPCWHQGCPKQSSFNHQGEKKPKFCAAHKTEGMINVVRGVAVVCKADECKRSASFNFEGTKKPFYCKVHSKDGMVPLVWQNICKKPACNKYAGFEFEGDGGRGAERYCRHHALPGMVNRAAVRRQRQRLGLPRRPHVKPAGAADLQRRGVAPTQHGPGRPRKERNHRRGGGRRTPSAAAAPRPLLPRRGRAATGGVGGAVVPPRPGEASPEALPGGGGAGAGPGGRRAL